MHRCTLKHAKAMLATPKEHIKNLYISADLEMDKDVVKNILDAFSEGTVGVEKVQYIGTLLPGDEFDKLITRNKSSLREFTVLFVGGISFKEMDNYLPLFLKCTALKSVPSQQFSKKMLNTLRMRGVRCLEFSRNPVYA